MTLGLSLSLAPAVRRRFYAVEARSGSSLRWPDDNGTYIQQPLQPLFASRAAAWEAARLAFHNDPRSKDRRKRGVNAWLRVVQVTL